MNLTLLLLGVLAGTFVEYVVHRWLLHRLMPAFHAIHHNAPDDTRPGIGDLAVLVAAAIVAATSMWFWSGAFAVGVVLWYNAYAALHLSFHHGASLTGPPCLQTRHDDHHKYYDCNYGVVTPLWDHLFGTTCAPVRPIPNPFTLDLYERATNTTHVCANDRGGRRCTTCFRPLP